MKEDQSYPKAEKLKSRKMIETIFTKGFAVKVYPVRIQFVFHDLSDHPRCQVGVSVSKRNFKSAVDRIRIKRQLREVYRLNKTAIVKRLDDKEKRISMMIIYASNVMPSYENLEALVVKALEKIRI